MKNSDLLIAANTLWVVVAAVLVMFMQAGFAFLEAGLTRMKNAAHIAGKNVLIFGVCSLVYWAVGFGIAFGDGNRLVGTSGFAPSVDSLLAIGQAPYSFFTTVPGGGRLPVRGRLRRCLARDRLGRDGRAREALGLLRLRGRLHADLLGHLALGLGPDGWLFGLGMQDFAGSTVVHYQGALAALAGALLLGPRIGKFEGGREPNAIPGHNIPYRRARDDHPLVRLVRLQPGLDAVRRHRRPGRLLRLRGADDEPRGCGRCGQRRSHGLARAAQARHLDDAERRPRGPRRRHRRVRVRGAVGGGRDRRCLGRDRCRRRARGRADRHRRPDRRRRGARHLRRLGHARDRPLRSPGAGGDPEHRPGRLRLHGLAPPGLACS